MNPNSSTPAQQIAQAIAELERSEQTPADPSQEQTDDQFDQNSHSDPNEYLGNQNPYNQIGSQSPSSQGYNQSSNPANQGSQASENLANNQFPTNQSHSNQSNPANQNNQSNPAYDSPANQNPQNSQTQNNQTFAYSEAQPYNQPYTQHAQPDFIDGTQIAKPGGWEGMSLEAQMAYVTEAALHMARSRESSAKHQAETLLSEAPPETRETLDGILKEALAESPHALSAPLSPKAKQALIDLAYGRMMRGRLPSEPSPVAGERPQPMDTEAQRTMKEATANFPELKELDWGRIAGGSR